VTLILRVGIGLVVAAAGLMFLVYGISQLMEIGSCGGYRVACPSGTGPLIVGMVFGTFFALGGAALAGVITRFIFVLIIAVVAGVVLGLADIDPQDTRPGVEVLIAVAAPMALFLLPGVGRQRPRGTVRLLQTPQQPQAAAPAANFGVPPKWQQKPEPPRPAATPAHAEDIASRLRQLEQLKQSGLLEEAEYQARRQQILGEL